MCFRPAETELPPVVCLACGKRINRVAGQLPKKCPFCKTPTDGMEGEDREPNSLSPATPLSMPSAPKTPETPAAPQKQ